jgi:hypothetical protein
MTLAGIERASRSKKEVWREICIDVQCPVVDIVPSDGGVFVTHSEGGPEYVSVLMYCFSRRHRKHALKIKRRVEHVSKSAQYSW